MKLDQFDKKIVNWTLGSWGFPMVSRMGPKDPWTFWT